MFRTVAHYRGKGQSQTRIALFVRHRWAGELSSGYWRCDPYAVILKPTPGDPMCNGCGSKLDWNDMVWQRYSGDPEGIQLALDLVYAKLTIELARELRERVREGAT